VFPVEKKIVHALIFNALLDINHVILVIYHAFLELFACFGFLPTVKKSELLSVKLFQMKNVRIPLNFSKSNPSFIGLTFPIFSTWTLFITSCLNYSVYFHPFFS
jgi:hypothetical protein